MAKTLLLKNYEKLRYKYDHPLEKKVRIVQPNDEILLDSIYITNALSSYLYSKIDKIKSLLVEKIDFKLFVTSSRNVNAFSFTHTEIGNIIMLNSEIIEKFNSSELDFVIGHELGHIVFNHLSNQYNYASNPSHNSYLELRNQEISSDRFAFMLVEDKSKAYQALFKLLTGVSNKVIFSNIFEYLHQIESNSSLETISLRKTHPSIYVRLKALLLFESSQLYYDYMGYNEEAPISKNKLEKKIRKISLEVDSGLELRKIDSLVNKAIIMSMILLEIDLASDIENVTNQMLYFNYMEEISHISKSDAIDIIKELLYKTLSYNLISIDELASKIKLKLSNMKLSDINYNRIVMFIEQVIDVNLEG